MQYTIVHMPLSNVVLRDETGREGSVPLSFVYIVHLVRQYKTWCFPETRSRYLVEHGGPQHLGGSEAGLDLPRGLLALLRVRGGEAHRLGGGVLGLGDQQRGDQAAHAVDCAEHEEHPGNPGQQRYQSRYLSIYLHIYSPGEHGGVCVVPIGAVHLHLQSLCLVRRSNITAEVSLSLDVV